MKAKIGHDIHARDLTSQADSLPALARRAVETFIREQLIISLGSLPPDSILNSKAACFVCIKTAHDLRGCIGTVEPVMHTLAEEIITNAIHAATLDPRFDPVSGGELLDLYYTVDVLETPEPALYEDLDPREYGVIVEDKSSSRRGLLLPNIEGIETPDQQIRIAARKAGLTPHMPLRLQRFRVRRFTEMI
jgi:AmmeMemoRadiSam system protein A